jgi:hypothetical protein
MADLGSHPLLAAAPPVVFSNAARAANRIASPSAAPCIPGAR